jgi:hypothetical protein
MRIQGVGSFATRRTSHHGYLPRIHSDGYRNGKVDWGEAAIVREVFTRFADGASCKMIAAELNRQGMPSPRSSWKAHHSAHERVDGLGRARDSAQGEVPGHRALELLGVAEGSGHRPRLRHARPRSEWITCELG